MADGVFAKIVRKTALHWAREMKGNIKERYMEDRGKINFGTKYRETLGELKLTN